MIYRKDIDGLRAIAILAVIFYHLDFPSISGGFIGVDIFFVISGFLITQTIYRDLDRNSFSLSNFYIKRIRRIVPILFITTIITTIITQKTAQKRNPGQSAKLAFNELWVLFDSKF